MTVCVSDANNAAYDGNLSTVNGLYRAEAYNLPSFHATLLGITTTTNIPVSFANAGNCQGIVLAIMTATSVSSYPDVTVTLQEYVGSVWTDRASVTLTEDEITASTEKRNNSGYLVPFRFASPYAVTTAASTWRFLIYCGTSSRWYMRTSNGTAPAYCAWCDTQVSFANNDTVIVVDALVIDQTSTWRGLLGTGDTTRSVAGWVCRNLDLDPDNVCLLTWENPPVASYTWTLDGYVVLSGDGGIRGGTSVARIPFAEQCAVAVMYTPTYGSVSKSGFTDTKEAGSTAMGRKVNFIWYGEVPTIERAWLDGAAVSGQPDIVLDVDVSSDWAAGDTLFITKSPIMPVAFNTEYTILSISGKTVTLTGNLAEDHLDGAVVTRKNGYGVTMNADSSYVTAYLYAPSNFKMSGVSSNNILFVLVSSNNSVVAEQELAYRSIYEVTHCTFDLYTAQCFTICPNEDGLLISDCAFRSGITLYAYKTLGMGAVTINSCCFTSIYTSGCGVYCITSVSGFLMSDCEFYNASNNSIGLTVQGAFSQVLDTTFFGGLGASDRGFVRLFTLFQCLFTRCKWDKCQQSISSRAYRHTCSFIDCEFGQEVANTADWLNVSDASFDLLFQNPLGLVINSDNMSIATDGSIARITSEDGVANVDYAYTNYGNYQRTGDGLTDTTTRLGGSGNFSLRMEQIISTDSFEYPLAGQPRAFPTGNIQNKTMLVSVWVKINAAAFYAGTHTKPTLNVKYDNLTTVTDVATGTTDWQRLDAVITPTTTYGQIEIWISMKTDATGSDAYVYIDNWNVPPPAGVTVDNSTVNQWAQGVPVWPPITTLPGPGTVLDEQMSDHTIAGSAGELLSKTEKKVDDAAILGGII